MMIEDKDYLIQVLTLQRNAFMDQITVLQAEILKLRQPPTKESTDDGK